MLYPIRCVWCLGSGVQASGSSFGLGSTPTLSSVVKLWDGILRSRAMLPPYFLLRPPMIHRRRAWARKATVKP